MPVSFLSVPGLIRCASYHLRPHYSSEHIDPKSKQTNKNILGRVSRSFWNKKQAFESCYSILYSHHFCAQVWEASVLFNESLEKQLQQYLKSVTLVILLSHLKPKDHYNFASLAKKKNLRTAWILRCYGYLYPVSVCSLQQGGGAGLQAQSKEPECGPTAFSEWMRQV